MTSVSDAWRNQYTTLDSVKAKKIKIAHCLGCGAEIEAGRRRFCKPCSAENIMENQRQCKQRQRDRKKLVRSD